MAGPDPVSFTSAVISGRDILTCKSEPSRLASGHPLRRTPCTICGEILGGNAMRVVIAVPMTVCTCDLPEIHSVAYLVRARHQAPGDLATASAASPGKVHDPGRLS
jgi:hypothetical protein